MANLDIRWIVVSRLQLGPPGVILEKINGVNRWKLWQWFISSQSQNILISLLPLLRRALPIVLHIDPWRRSYRSLATGQYRRISRTAAIRLRLVRSSQVYAKGKFWRGRAYPTVYCVCRTGNSVLNEGFWWMTSKNSTCCANCLPSYEYSVPAFCNPYAHW